MKKFNVLLFVLIAFAFSTVYPQTAKTFDFAAMMNIHRVGDPQISPDGKMIVYSIGDVDMTANKTLSQIYLISVDGGTPRQITKEAKSSGSPRWSPDGKKIAFTSGGQVWTMDSDGGSKKQITGISTGAGNPVWSPDGKMIAFVSDVYPECTTDDCNKRKDDYAENSKVTAHVTDRLLYRHWVEWRDTKRMHVFVAMSDGSGAARDLTFGDFDAPPYAASSSIDYAFSPDSKEIAYLRNPDKVEAVSTNSDIFIRPIEGSASAKNITVKNTGYDATPIYTPDGKYIIFRSQATAGFESDRWRIMRYNRSTGETVELSRGYDNYADDILVSPDSKIVYFSSGVRGASQIMTVPVEPDFRLRIATFVKPLIASEISATGMTISDDGQTLVFLSSSIAAPPEITRAKSDGSGIYAVTKTNLEMMQDFRLQKAENVEWSGAGGTKINGYLVKPANFDPAKKYPLLVLIHGGPQGAWNNGWGYRWNPQIFASAGYVVFMPNPRGSTGYGQQLTNEVSGDWGGRAYTDIMNGTAEIVKNSYIDKNHIGAAGASYGGYMVDWILGHNTDPRFKFTALVSHAGVYNLESMYGATEELWFTNYEFKGSPWENPALYQKWSPNKFVKNFKTPTLVTCGELDYRVPYGESLQLYTALQLQNVPSKLVVFPDEGHWILKPQNSEFWYGQVMTWLDKYLKG